MGTLRKSLRDLAEKLLPTPVFQQMAAARSRRHDWAFLRENGYLEQVRQYVEQHGTVVQAGPFAGLVYPTASALNRWSIPKLTGTYESELHPLLEVLQKRSYDCIIDIGSAEGYYACGLARMFQKPVLAYDPEPLEKSASAEMARLNKVSHLVQMGNLFTTADMERLADQRSLVVCDCEGFEGVLFTEETLPLTQKWDLLIELHGDTAQSLPALNWPHRTTTIAAQRKTGLANEFRVPEQYFLICDSQHETM